MMEMTKNEFIIESLSKKKSVCICEIEKYYKEKNFSKENLMKDYFLSILNKRKKLEIMSNENGESLLSSHIKKPGKKILGEVVLMQAKDFLIELEERTDDRMNLFVRFSMIKDKVEKLLKTNESVEVAFINPSNSFIDKWLREVHIKNTKKLKTWMIMDFHENIYLLRLYRTAFKGENLFFRDFSDKRIEDKKDLNRDVRFDFIAALGDVLEKDKKSIFEKEIFKRASELLLQIDSNQFHFLNLANMESLGFYLRSVLTFPKFLNKNKGKKAEVCFSRNKENACLLYHCNLQMKTQVANIVPVFCQFDRNELYARDDLMDSIELIKKRETASRKRRSIRVTEEISINYSYNKGEGEKYTNLTLTLGLRTKKKDLIKAVGDFKNLRWRTSVLAVNDELLREKSITYILNYCNVICEDVFLSTIHMTKNQYLDCLESENKKEEKERLITLLKDMEFLTAWICIQNELKERDDYDKEIAQTIMKDHFFSGKKVGVISYNEVLNYAEIKCNKRKSKETVRCIFSCLKRFLLLSDVSLKEYEGSGNRMSEVQRAETSAMRKESLTYDEMNKLIELCFENKRFIDDVEANYVLFRLLTGLTASICLALQWNDIIRMDGLDLSTIKIDKYINSESEVKYFAQEGELLKDRPYPVTDVIRSVLLKRYKYLSKSIPKDELDNLPLFFDHQTKKRIDMKKANIIIKNFLEGIDIPEEYIVFFSDNGEGIDREVDLSTGRDLLSSNFSHYVRTFIDEGRFCAMMGLKIRDTLNANYAGYEHPLNLLLLKKYLDRWHQALIPMKQKTSLTILQNKEKKDINGEMQYIEIDLTIRSAGLLSIDMDAENGINGFVMKNKGNKNSV